MLYSIPHTAPSPRGPLGGANKWFLGDIVPRGQGSLLWAEVVMRPWCFCRLTPLRLTVLFCFAKGWDCGHHSWKKNITFTLVGSIDSEYWKYLPLTIKLAKYAAPGFRIPLLGLRGRRLQKSVIFASVTPLSLTTTAAPSCCCKSWQQNWKSSSEPSTTSSKISTSTF